MTVPSVGGSRAAAGRPRPAQRIPWRTLGWGAAAAAAFFATALILSSGLGLIDMARWAAAQQRAFHGLVGDLLAVEGGGVWASGGLVFASLVYGFLHAAIPGHGKFVIAGAGLASRMSLIRLIALSVAASLCQALTAIALVYGGFLALDMTAGWAMIATDRVLIPLSYLAILAIGVVLMVRAIKGLRRAWRHHAHRLGLPHDHGPGCSHHHGGGCNHRHAPTLEESDAVRSWRDAAAIVLSIGMRPCTGAVFVLVAAWRFDLHAVGIAAALAMGLGTGAFIAIVATSAVSARGATLFAAGRGGAMVTVPAMQLLAGALIVLVSVAFLAGSLLAPL